MSVYLYGVMDSADAIPADLCGVFDVPIRGIVVDDLCAVIADLDADALAPAGDDGARMAALALGAVAHDRAIHALYQRGAILPAPFATLFPDIDAIRALIRERRAEWAAALARVRGRGEIDVKIYVDRPALIAALMATLPTAAGRGANYLLQKKAQRDAETDADHQITAVINALHSDVVRLAAASVALPVRNAGDDPHAALTGRMAYLIQPERLDDVIAVYARHESEWAWLSVAIAGVFAPYHFAAGWAHDPVGEGA
jgi:hypothetical protein